MDLLSHFIEKWTFVLSEYNENEISGSHYVLLILFYDIPV